jgi:methylmalonyl-CoA mutase C-terminal domain/subunit
VTGPGWLRVVVAGEPGDPRVLALAGALRDAGTEVVLTGGASAAGIAAAAVQEDADAVVVVDPPAALPGALADAGAEALVAVVGDPGGLPGDLLAFPAGTAPEDVVAALRRAAGA